VPVVSSPQAPGVREVIKATAVQNRSPVGFVDREWEDSPVALSGRHQRWNAAVAVAALAAGGFDVDFSAIRSGLAEVRWPARFQFVGPARQIVIDGAHNPDGARALVETWRESFGGRKAIVIFGAVTQKNHREMVQLLDRIAHRWIFTTVDSPRAIPASELARRTPGAAITGDLVEALDRALAPDPGQPSTSGDRPTPDRIRSLANAPTLSSPILVCGSLYLAGEALAILDPGATSAFERSAQ
jgi:folylpolyglutamate synthase/dihydropteroate synthase